MDRRLALIVTGAPLAARAHDVAAEVMNGGWSVVVAATQSALAWIDAEAVRAVTGSGVQVDYRTPDQPKRGSQPDAVVVCPATFNTINKVAHGIADNYAVGLICEAVGDGIPVIMFPMINHRLWQHPARAASFESLQLAKVVFRDMFSGQLSPQPVISGTGAAAVERFDPVWVRATLV